MRCDATVTDIEAAVGAVGDPPLLQLELRDKGGRLLYSGRFHFLDRRWDGLSLVRDHEYVGLVPAALLELAATAEVIRV